MSEIVYLSGPMTGLPDFNFPAFHRVAADWRAEGWEVINPAESLHGDTSQPREVYIRLDIQALLKVTAIAVLPGWQQSRGAVLEVEIARQLALPVYNANTFAFYEETVVQEAQRLVYGDRGETYGHPLDDFARTSQMWEAILGQPVSPEQVALCMLVLKVSRECYQPKRDNRVDMAGYAECLDRIVAERQRRAKKW